MMQRILNFSVDDVIIDQETVEERLNSACADPAKPYRLRGVCQVDQQVAFLLVPAEEMAQKEETYTFGMLADTTVAGFETAVSERWFAGLEVLGILNLGEDRYLLVMASNN